MQLSIIILNYNTKKLLEECLKSVFNKIKIRDYEVIVVDNASTDGSVEMVKSNFPQVKLIENDENLGFARGNNQGIRISKGRYVLLLNNDTLVLDDDFDKVIKFMDENKDIGILGCRINNPDGSLQLSCYKLPSMWEMFTHYTFLTRLFPNSRWCGDYRNWPHNEIKEVGFVIGAFFLIRKDVIDDIGLLDEGFFLNAEESEYCLRAKKAGWKTVFYPDFKIIHYGGQTKKFMKERELLSTFKGTDYLIKKHHNLAYFITYRFLSFILSLIRLGIFGTSLLFANGVLREEIKNKFNHSKKLLAFQLGHTIKSKYD